MSLRPDGAAVSGVAWVGAAVEWLVLVLSELVTLIVNVSFSSKPPTFLSVMMSLGLAVWASTSSAPSGMRACASFISVRFGSVEDSSAVQFIVPLIIIFTEPSGCSVEVLSVGSNVVGVCVGGAVVVVGGVGVWAAFVVVDLAEAVVLVVFSDGL